MLPYHIPAWLPLLAISFHTTYSRKYSLTLSWSCLVLCLSLDIPYSDYTTSTHSPLFWIVVLLYTFLSLSGASLEEGERGWDNIRGDEQVDSRGTIHDGITHATPIDIIASPFTRHPFHDPPKTPTMASYTKNGPQGLEAGLPSPPPATAAPAGLSSSSHEDSNSLSSSNSYTQSLEKQPVFDSSAPVFRFNPKHWSMRTRILACAGLFLALGAIVTGKQSRFSEHQNKEALSNSLCSHCCATGQWGSPRISHKCGHTTLCQPTKHVNYRLQYATSHHAARRLYHLRLPLH